MPNIAPEFEMTDVEGTSNWFAGSVPTTPIDVPTVAGNDIEELSIRCRIDQPNQTRLEVSIDGGVQWFRLAVGESISTEPRAGLKQIKVKAAGTNIASCFYEIDMNRGQA